MTEPPAGFADLALALALALGLGIGSASAQPPPGAPPPEALAACHGKSSNDICQANLQRGTIKGVCWAPQGRPLACRPSNAPLGAHQGPPPEAIAACASKKAADACEAPSDRGAQNGVCRGPSGRPLACLTKGAPPPPPQ